MKFGTLMRFGQNIHPHLFSGTILEIQFSRVVKVGYEEFCSLNVFCKFGTRHINILGQGEGAHIVLVNNFGLNFVSLGLKELMCPKNVARFVI